MSSHQVAETSQPAVIVSSDSHISPTGEQLREYCPKALLDEFDAFHRAYVEAKPYQVPTPEKGANRRQALNSKSAGHYDMNAQLRDMDDDGIAAAVVFHGAQSAEPFPFGVSGVIDMRRSIDDLDRTRAGMRMYNRWMSEASAIDPARVLGLAYVPLWDIDLVVEEIKWAHSAGLRGVNWPAPRPWALEYDHPDWEPVWATAAELDMPLVTHAGAEIQGHHDGINSQHSPLTFPLIYIEVGWPSRRGIGRLIFSGAFERHPNLKSVVVEQPLHWWEHTMYEYDAAWRQGTPELWSIVPKMPSEYCQSNVFVGASFLSRHETEVAIDKGYDSRYMWGSDYPHREGSWGYADEGEPNRTRLSLRNTFTGLPADKVGAILGDTACSVFNLDGDVLQSIARRIDAPTVDEIVAPLSEQEVRDIDRVRDRQHDFSLAFRAPGE